MRFPQPALRYAVRRRAVALCATVLVVAVSLAGSTGASARSEAVVLPDGIDWSADATDFRGQNGKRFTFLCPADGEPERAWGTDVYSDDSSVCTAAVHTGAITVANGGVVTIEIRPGQASYTGSARNGVTTENFAAWDGSFVISGTAGVGPAGVKVGGAGWDAKGNLHRGQNGSRYVYVCPSGGTPQTVWGTNTYTDDSSVCTAAVQVGAITTAAGGNVTIEIRRGRSSYASFTANGITSRANGPWAGSFVIAGAPPIPGSPGGGGGGSTTTTTTQSGGQTPPPTATVTGTVLVNGQVFTGGTLPYNVVVDVTEGTIQLSSTVGTLKVFGEGGVTAAFKLVRGKDGKKAVIELQLAKGDFSVCPKPKSTKGTAKTTRKKQSVAAAAPKVVRQIWGDGKGSFRTKGRYAAATVRGTKWLTTDRCDGTNVRVERGVVSVSDFPKRTQVTVRAGRSYLARP
jgi:hypothetical protein